MSPSQVFSIMKTIDKSLVNMIMKQEIWHVGVMAVAELSMDIMDLVGIFSFLSEHFRFVTTEGTVSINRDGWQPYSLSISLVSGI